jgi:hypothetical protein
LLLGCDNTDENTGESSLSEINKPMVTIDYPYATVTNVTESNAKYPFTISIPQAVDWDVVLKIDVKGGTATNGEDYSVPEYINIPAGSTTGKAVIEIFEDEDIEETESFILVIGDLAVNSIATPKEVTFNIANLTSGDLAITLSWDMSEPTTDNSGDAIAPTDFADLIFSLSSTPDNAGDIAVADGGSFEELIMESTLPDGTYYLSASFYAANEDIVRDLDLMLDFYQLGVGESSLTFPSALNSGNSCSSIYYNLVEVTKSGESYTITEIGEITPVNAEPFIGTATVLVDDWADDYVDGEIEIEAGSNANEFYVRMYSNPYIDNPDTAYLIVTIDPTTGNVTGVSSEPWDYGNVTPVTATGTVAVCTKTIDLTLDYFYGESTHYDGQQLKLQLQ